MHPTALVLKKLPRTLVAKVIATHPPKSGWEAQQEDLATLLELVNENLRAGGPRAAGHIVICF